MTKAKDIKKGFKTLWWTATEDARTYKNIDTGRDETVVTIQYPDKGLGERIFEPDSYVAGEQP